MVSASQLRHTRFLLERRKPWLGLRSHCHYTCQCGNKHTTTPAKYPVSKRMRNSNICNPITCATIDFQSAMSWSKAASSILSICSVSLPNPSSLAIFRASARTLVDYLCVTYMTVNGHNHGRAHATQRRLNTWATNRHANRSTHVCTQTDTDEHTRIYMVTMKTRHMHTRRHHVDKYRLWLQTGKYAPSRAMRRLISYVLVHNLPLTQLAEVLSSIAFAGSRNQIVTRMRYPWLYHRVTNKSAMRASVKPLQPSFPRKYCSPVL